MAVFNLALGSPEPTLKVTPTSQLVWLVVLGHFLLLLLLAGALPGLLSSLCALSLGAGHHGHFATPGPHPRLLSMSPAQKSLQTPDQSPAAFWTLGRCTAVSLLPYPLPPHFTFSSRQPGLLHSSAKFCPYDLPSWPQVSQFLTDTNPVAS